MEIQIKENISLADYTTFRIGGPARYFYEAKTTGEIKEALLWAKEKGVPYFVMGGGSNLLVSDDGFDGLVIKVQSSTFRLRSGQEFGIIEADAGVPLARLVVESVNNDLAGLEWAIGIPGTIGGAVCGNAGAYGHSISESVKGAKAMMVDGQIVNFDKNACCFCYRGSAFKEKMDNLIIFEVELQLAVDERGKAKERMKEILTTRSAKIPPLASSGSFFKNYLVKNGDPLIKKFPELSDKIKGGKIAAAYFIEQAGLKGRMVGGAKIADEHANFIVNTGGAKAKEVLELAEICKEKVKEKFDVDLEEETRYVGF
ncbi:MAG: UDP-N-acetylmuramate dehydrogenase [bacterium]